MAARQSSFDAIEIGTPSSRSIERRRPAMPLRFNRRNEPGQLREPPQADDVREWLNTDEPPSSRNHPLSKSSRGVVLPSLTGTPTRRSILDVFIPSILPESSHPFPTTFDFATATIEPPGHTGLDHT